MLLCTVHFFGTFDRYVWVLCLARGTCILEIYRVCAFGFFSLLNVAVCCNAVVFSFSNKSKELFFIFVLLHVVYFYVSSYFFFISLVILRKFISSVLMVFTRKHWSEKLQKGVGRRQKRMPLGEKKSSTKINRLLPLLVSIAKEHFMILYLEWAKDEVHKNTKGFPFSSCLFFFLSISQIQ